mgnify:CR=1 FL=1
MASTKSKDHIKAKRLTKKVSIAAIAKEVGKSPTFVAAALNNNQRLTPEEAKKVGTMLDLDPESTASLSAFPIRTDCDAHRQLLLWRWRALLVQPV